MPMPLPIQSQRLLNANGNLLLRRDIRQIRVDEKLTNKM